MERATSIGLTRLRIHPTQAGIVVRASRYSLCLLAGLLLAACNGSRGPETAEPQPEESAAPQSVFLESAEREKMGIQVTVATESSVMGEIAGYGLVLQHETIAAASADLASAQASSDAKALAQRRLTALLGADAPVHADGGVLLAELSSGKVKLVRVSFPASALPAVAPKQLRLAHFAVGEYARNWISTEIWDAPADPAHPGRNLFTLLRGTDAVEGERLQAWAATGTMLRGVTLPASAVLEGDDAFWCYIEKPAGTFKRTAIDTSRPVAGGYFVTEGIAAGDAVVTAGADLLLPLENAAGTDEAMPADL